MARRYPLDLEHWALLGGGACLLGLLVLAIGAPRNWWSRNLELNFRTYSAAGLQEGMPVDRKSTRLNSSHSSVSRMPSSA